MAAKAFLHLEMHVVPLWTDITSSIVQEPHFTSVATDDGVHPSKRVDSQESWDIRTHKDSGSIGTQVMLAVCILHCYRYDNACIGGLSACTDSVDSSLSRKLEACRLVSTGLCPPSCVDGPSLTTEAIFGSRAGEKHRLTLWIILPCKVVLDEVLMEQLRMLLLLPLW